MESDADILKRFSRTGDEAAFVQLVERHAPMIRGVALRGSGDEAVADEVTQTVFAILARKARSLAHEGIAGWLHRTAFMETRNAVRKAARYHRALRNYENQHMPSVPSPSLSAPDEIIPHLDHALTKLKPEERELVVRRYYEGQGIREIAAAEGSNEEACRKRLQRTIQRLGRLLERRGLSTSTATLTALLSGQSFCAPSASAAAIGTAALEASAALPQATLAAHAFLLVKATAIKTTVVAVAIAAVPCTMLWRQNHRLRQDIAALREAAAVIPRADGAPADARETRGGLGRQRPAGRPAAAAAVAPAAVPAAADLLSPEVLTELVKGDADLRATQAFNRLCARVPDLTAEQKERLRVLIASRTAAQAQAVEQLLATGDLQRLADPDSLTDQEKALLKAAAEPHELDATTLAGILTPEQMERHARAEEARRTAAAENAANDALRQVDQYVDLTAEQKDALFQKLANQHLGIGAPQGPQTPGEDPQDLAIRSVLTPEQAAAYETARAQEKENLERLMKLVPALPGAAAAPAK